MKRYLWLLFVAGTAIGVGSVAIARVAPSISGGSGNGRIKSVNAGSQVNVSDDGQGNVTISATPPSQGSAGDSIASSSLTVINADNEGSGDGYISMRINNSTKAVVAPNGRVGINTTNPSTQLDVNGVITATSIDANIAANKVQSGSLGTSVMVSSVSAQSVNGRSLKSTNDAADGLVPKFDAATGGVTWSADNAGGSGGGDNFGTHTASKVIDANGFAVTRLSSITFNSGTSPIIAGMISSAAANTIVDATQINATNKGTNKLLGMNADNTLSFFTDQTSAGGGDNYGNHVATMPQVSAFAVTVASGTVYGQLSVGSITVNSAGAGVINSTHAVMKIKVTNLSDDDFEVAEDSVSVNGVKVSTDQHNTPGVLNNKTYDATLIGNVFTSSRSVSWGAILTSSLSIITQTSSKTVGMAQFRNAISSEANCGYGVPWRAPAGITGTPTGNLMIRGGSTGTQRYVVGFASVPVNLDVQFATITTAVVNFDFPTDAGGTAEGASVLSNVPLTGITFIPGDWYQPVYCRDGDAAQDASSTDSYGARFSMDYQVSQ